jgi:hypothetical protein
VPWKTTNGVGNAVLQALQFQKMCFSQKFPGGSDISHCIYNESFVEDQFNVQA